MTRPVPAMDTVLPARNSRVDRGIRAVGMAFLAGCGWFRARAYLTGPRRFSRRLSPASGPGPDRDDGDLDEHAGHQVGADRGADRLVRPGELLPEGGVELGEQVEVTEVNQAGHDVIQARARRLQQYLDVPECLRRLACDAAADQLTAPGIETALARQEDQVTDGQPGGVRPRGRRSLSRGDELLHRSALPRSFIAQPEEAFPGFLIALPGKHFPACP